MISEQNEFIKMAVASLLADIQGGTIVTNCQDDKRWFAVRVRSRGERGISDALQSKGYESFLPTYRTRTKVSLHSRQLEKPFFPGYVFCRFDVLRRLPILTTPGVQHIVGIGKAPVPVEDREIESLQRAVEARLEVRPSEFMKLGQSVRIAQGPLAGMEGILLDFKKPAQLVLSVSLLCRSVRVEIDKEIVMNAASLHWPVSLPDRSRANAASAYGSFTNRVQALA
jgi:transcription antitermination factor NusG